MIIDWYTGSTPFSGVGGIQFLNTMGCLLGKTVAESDKK